MDWWKNLFTPKSTSTSAGSPSIAEQEYNVFATEYDLAVPYDEVYDVIEPDTRYPESEYLIKNQLETINWLESNAPQLQAVRHDIAHQTTQWHDPKVLVSILIDHSGSLVGDKQKIAYLIAKELDSILSQIGISFEMLGFTTRSWGGGQSRKSWAMCGAPKMPGRLCDLLHIIYRAWDDKSEQGDRFKFLLDPQLLKENVDGEAVQWAKSRFDASPFSKHLIVMISDGAPVDDSTLLENTPYILVDHLLRMIKNYEQVETKDIIGFGIGYEVNEYYKHSGCVSEIERVPEALSSLIGMIGGRLRSISQG